MTLVQAITFKGQRTAAKALATLAEQDDYPWIDDVAVISVGKAGLVRVDSTWAQYDSSVELGVGSGSLTGALIGALFGPGAALAGAFTGGSIAAAIAAMLNYTMEDDRLEKIGDYLENDTSALVLVADAPTVSDFSSAVGPFDGELIESELSSQEVETLRAVLQTNVIA